jgi:feruloyl esterase
MDPEHSVFSSLEQWVEHDVAPHKIVASKYVSPDNPASGAVMTRPLCAYPEFAKYKGSGDIHEAANFVCVK